MRLSCSRDTRRPGMSLVSAIALFAIMVSAASAFAWKDPDTFGGGPYDPHSALVTHGEYVMNVGNLQINITNWGLIGSYPGSGYTFSDAPSAQWPAGSGNEYLFAAGIWIGGVLLGQTVVSTGQYQQEITARGEVAEDTIYEAKAAQLVRPAGNSIASGRRFPEPDSNDDGDTFPSPPYASGVPLVDEEVLNGYDDDGDGLIDEDFAQIGNQMFVTTEYDNTRLAQQRYPDHTPMNLEVIQSTYAWESDLADNFVGFSYAIANIGVTTISNVYIGFFADADIGPRSGTNVASDDMVGSYSGPVRASDGSWVPVEVGYMYDAAENNRLDGYFGIAFLGHDTDPSGLHAPKRVQLRSFQRFSGSSSFQQGGDPTNDNERYELLSRQERDQNSPPGKADDYRFLVSGGPFETLAPQDTLHFDVAMAVGPGLNGLLSVCAEATLTYFGNYFDQITSATNHQDEQFNPGMNGREARVCRDDFVPPEAFDQIRPDFGDTSCVSQSYLLAQPALSSAEVFSYIDPLGHRKDCAYVNLDNCFECYRQKPHTLGQSAEDARCTQADVEQYWDCNQSDHGPGCTGVDGNETQVKWLVGMAPPPPGMRVWPTDDTVHVYWDDLSENTPDVRLNLIDFESYRIWRADNWTRPFGSSVDNGPESALWQLIAEYDVVDSFTAAITIPPDTFVYYHRLPLGRNTGMNAIKYQPAVLGNPRFAGLMEATEAIVLADRLGAIVARPDLYDEFGQPIEAYQGLIPWQGYPSVLDTFWAEAARPGSTYVDPNSGDLVVVSREKKPTQYYEYVDHNVHNGYLYFYSVTASDHGVALNDGVARISGPGQSGDPASSFTDTSPGTLAQTAEERNRYGANIFVYPNPATRDALADFQQFQPSGTDPTGVRVNFANLPAAHNTIKIFTLSGDLVQTIDHDGTGGYGEASWNLMSRNSQEIVSGIYLYVVHADDSRFEDFIGKFVVVR